MPDINWSPVADGLRAMAEKNYNNFKHIQYFTIKELVKIHNRVEYYTRICERERTDDGKCRNCSCPWCDEDNNMNFEKWLKEKYRDED